MNDMKRNSTTVCFILRTQWHHHIVTSLHARACSFLLFGLWGCFEVNVEKIRKCLKILSLVWLLLLSLFTQEHWIVKLLWHVPNQHLNYSAQAQEIITFLLSAKNEVTIGSRRHAVALLCCFYEQFMTECNVLQVPGWRVKTVIELSM